jgi:SNF2 family DNA or RNA helicase
MPVLSPLAISKYLERPFADFDVYLKLSDKKLDALGRKYAFDPLHWNRLRRHQKIMACIGARTKRFCFWADTGTGKTYLTMLLIKHFGLRTLVLVQARANKDEWEREIAKHMPDLSHLVLRGTSQQKWAALESTDVLLIVETYAGFIRMVSSLVPVKKKQKLKLDRRLLNRMLAAVKGLVLDESQNVRGHGSLTFRACRQLSKRCAEIMFALSGTPHGQDPTDLWSQFYLIDHGETLGQTLGLYRAVFFSEKMNYFGGLEYTFQQRKTKLLHQIIKNRSITIEADAADLPPLSHIRKYTMLPEDAETHYRQALAIVRQRKSVRELENAVLRMRQISSGFIGYRDDDTGEKCKFAFAENPKQELLLSILESIDPIYKTVVFYEFTWSALQVAKELDRLRIPFVHLYGGTKDPKVPLHQFDHGAPRVLLLQNKFGAGLNLQVARYGIFYETPLSSIVRKQCRRRFERQESKHRNVFLYDLLVRGTLDERFLESVLAGEDLMKKLIGGKFDVDPASVPSSSRDTQPARLARSNGQAAGARGSAPRLGRGIIFRDSGDNRPESGETIP